MKKENVSVKKFVMLNLFQHPHLTHPLFKAEEILKQVQHDNRRRGFTLIELLVVVLIVGILTAVALPQYQLMVMKSRISAQLPLLRAIAQDNERFYLEHGYYTQNWDDLDVDIPKAFKKGSNRPYFALYPDCVAMHYGPGIFISYLHGTDILPGQFRCNGYGSQLYARICQGYGQPIYSWTPDYTHW